MSGFDFDAVVVGAGAVGLACGYALGRSGQTVLVIEKEDGVGEGVSSRNSEVIHAGLYYPTGSLKARLCVAGRRLMYDFLASHGVTFERCGKLVVATEVDEVGRLDAIAAQAEANGVEGVSRLSASQTHALEPQVRAVEALLSAQSGIFDSHGYMLALQGEIEQRGGTVVMNTPFDGAAPLPGGGWRIRTGGEAPAAVSARRLVISAGLGSQAAAARIEGFPAAAIPELHYGKGSYFLLHGRPPFSHLVYPPPIPGALGVHYKRDLGGQAHFGPDLEYVEHEDYQVRAERAEAFYAYIRRFWPALPDGALTPDYAGIRPKLHGPGEPQPDFGIAGPEQHGLDGLVALFGIESPGLTSSLAIGDEVAGRLA
ncbi:MAG: NAD(P)/FAD-dependent oxidoreductase [Caulobacteraceae bacterium]|nr:NAD(P)/FAD-dependent oxidoreductase [Caulobacteraceae bacterium]